MDKLAAISSPQDLAAFYKKLKYRVLNKDTNHPYFNTNFEAFDKWHLLSPEQIKKHKIGICYDTAAMTDKVLKDLGVEHSNYFAHSDNADGWENDPTHAFNVYKDENGDWRWLEGSWGDYKDNDWKEHRKKKLVKRIVKALADASGKKQKLHEVAEFPEPGIGMKDWYAEMLKNPVKKAELEKKAGPSLRDKVNAGVPGAAEKLKAQEAEKAYRAAHPNPLGSLNEQKAYLKQQGKKNLAKLTPEQRAKFWQDANKFQVDALRFRSLAGSMMPGIGLAGAAGVIGAGETAASGLEGKSIGDSIASGGAAGAGAFVGGKVLQGAAHGAVLLGKHAITGAKHLSPALRRFALKLNAHDPYHRKLMTRLLNFDLPKYPRTRQGDMFLTHSTVSGASGGRGFDTARQFVQEGKYMPSMGLAPENGVTWYGSGVGDPSAVSGAPVRFFFDESVLKMPRTAIYPVSDAATPIYSDMVAAVGPGKLADKSVREALYDGFYRTGGLRGTRTTISPRQASYRNSVEVEKGNFGKTFEVKPYHDIPADAPRAVSIGRDRAGNFGDPALQRELGERGIPYYFVDEKPIPGQFMDFRSAGAPPSDGFILDPREMAREFAPKIRP